MFDSRDVAAYIAQRCHAEGIEFNNTKMQKLLYCAYGCLLAWKNERICDEYPRAWRYGPVFPKVFNYIHRGKDIAAFSNAVSTAEGKLAEDVREAVSGAIRVFGRRTASWLTTWSHMEGSPWYRTVNGDEANEGAGLNGFIPEGYIKEYFAQNVLDLQGAANA